MSIYNFTFFFFCSNSRDVDVDVMIKGKKKKNFKAGSSSIANPILELTQPAANHDRALQAVHRIRASCENLICFTTKWREKEEKLQLTPNRQGRLA
jgi:hypothetical protein